MENLILSSQSNQLNPDQIFKKPKVLIVEDDLLFESIWDYIIKNAIPEAKMEWATSTTEAIEMIKEAEENHRSFDLIISDIFLSGSKTGIDLWRLYHKKFQEKFILVSGADRNKVNLYFKGLGEPHYMQKPIVIHDAIYSIQNIMNDKVQI